MSDEHYPDGKRWHESASYSGLVFQCGCGERFMEYGELLAHCEDFLRPPSGGQHRGDRIKEARLG